MGVWEREGMGSEREEPACAPELHSNTASIKIYQNTYVHHSATKEGTPLLSLVSGGDPSWCYQKQKTNKPKSGHE